MIPPIASRFVAGETLEEAIGHVGDLNERDIGGILNLLGEHYDDPASATTDTESYLAMTDRIAASGIESCISVKPSQLGLNISEEQFRENLERIVGAGAQRDVFVWIDMEDHTTTDATLSAFRWLAREYPRSVGVCLQANLHRTREDLEQLAGLQGKVRLVKGAYAPPTEVGYQDKSRINRRFDDLLEYMFHEFDGGIAVGSHDDEMIDAAIRYHELYGTGFEVQMLMGVREEEQTRLAMDYDVYQYVPYGEKWLSYFYRRVVERKENLLFAARAVLHRN